MRSIVVVGYGVAGLTAADTLREEGFEGGLTVVGAEPGRPCSRPALSKALLAGTDGRPHLEALALPAPVHGGTELLGRRAVGLVDGRLELDDGTSLPFDGLVIATGSTPRRFTDSPDELTLRTVRDGLVMRERLAARPAVVVLGGGPLGTEVASSARAAGCEVTLVELGTPMVRQTGTYLGRLCTRAALDHGVRVVDALADAVVPLPGGGPGAGMEITLSTGEVLTADLVVTAVGDRVDDEWLTGSGLLTDGRLLVDDSARVIGADGAVVPGVVAAGDVAWLPTADGPRRVPLWMHAIDHARTAARTLLAGDAAEPYLARPYFWTEQFGLHLRMCGPIPVGEPEIVDGDPAAGSALLRWDGVDGGPGSSAAISYGIPVPRLRRLAASAPARTAAIV